MELMLPSLVVDTATRAVVHVYAWKKQWHAKTMHALSRVDMKFSDERM